MDSRFAGKLISTISANQNMVGMVDAYGIELEAEGCPPPNMVAAQERVYPLFALKTDGSLRNNGVEFVSRPLIDTEVPAAIDVLYKSRQLWITSPRAGIHIHVNALHWTMAQLRNVLASYSFVEPFVYKRCGSEREENIFCVPWYRAPEEADRMAQMFKRGDTGYLRQSCKYSALYCGPIRSYGSIEFRHARTFDTARELLLWWRMVERICAARTMGDPIALYASTDAATVVRNILGREVDEYTDEQLNKIAHDRGAVDTALLFAEPTYKFGEWGEPGSFDVVAELTEDEGYVPEPDVDELANALVEERQARIRRTANQFFARVELAPPEEPDDEDEWEDEEETQEEDE